MNDGAIELFEENNATEVPYPIKIRIYLVLCSIIQIMGFVAIALEKNHMVKLETTFAVVGFSIVASGIKWYLSTNTMSKTLNIFATLGSVYVFIFIFYKL